MDEKRIIIPMSAAILTHGVLFVNNYEVEGLKQKLQNPA
jgi:hypothetical protein